MPRHIASRQLSPEPDLESRHPHSLRQLDGSVLDRAYGPFLERIDQMVRFPEEEGD